MECEGVRVVASVRAFLTVGFPPANEEPTVNHMTIDRC